MRSAGQLEAATQAEAAAVDAEDFEKAAALSAQADAAKARLADLHLAVRSRRRRLRTPGMLSACSALTCVSLHHLLAACAGAILASLPARSLIIQPHHTAWWGVSGSLQAAG